MGKGKIWSPEWSQYKDRFTGVQVTQLTDYLGHSHHLYFTENGWYEDGQKLLFCSDRENKTNLFQIDLQTGKMIQLTDYDTTYDMSACLHPDETKAYFRRKNKIMEIDLQTLKEKMIYEGPEDLIGGNLNCTADGKYLITCMREDFSNQIQIDLKNGYIGHRELMEAKPKSQILQISIVDQKAKVVFEEENFITHINTSPTKKNLITFCHEGPWQLVDHRIWGLDLKTGEVWKIRERKEEREMVGHEYWHTDGETIGYHGFRANGTAFFGKISYDNQQMEEVEFPFRNWHAQSNDFSKIVVDGRSPLNKLIVWSQVNGKFTNPKVLCEHRCSFHVQKVHAHPRFRPDGNKLLFTSDKNGYGNLYLVDLPKNFHSLPDYVTEE
ncbi:oligogalacturonate lyase family protein [Bacillus sp. SD088]|uniref:oligogalacturonate lyase family protein n=1 Tax=Bacillus sp. SD088 TaxID=2782012 RepID=UPI001A96563A|nr:oligogalacturonate lyase family protein [Bacillus sp. SD088]MBO0995386.1 PD40 domain-containing protein [Bacillus sp. SD088]